MEYVVCNLGSFKATVLERAPLASDHLASGKLIRKHLVDSVDVVLLRKITVVRCKSLYADFAILDGGKCHA